jgi:hypothetical protein
MTIVGNKRQMDHEAIRARKDKRFGLPVSEYKWHTDCGSCHRNVPQNEMTYGLYGQYLCNECWDRYHIGS